MLETMAMPTGDSAAPAIFFDRVLQPHRSLPPSSFAIVIVLLGILGFGVSVGFFLLGAWPVCGFFGLDVALLYLAIGANYRGARLQERLRLTEHSFTIERIGNRGDKSHWNFEPFWLRVILEEQDGDNNRLLVASHGTSLVLGSFLGSAQRRCLAADIKAALACWRASTASPAR